MKMEKKTLNSEFPLLKGIFTSKYPPLISKWRRDARKWGIINVTSLFPQAHRTWQGGSV